MIIYVCMYIYIYVCMYIYIYIYICVRTYLVILYYNIYLLGILFKRYVVIIASVADQLHIVLLVVFVITSCLLFDRYRF